MPPPMSLAHPRDLRGAALALAAATLFGASSPIAKLLLPGAGPLMLAGLLYLGAGLGLVMVRVLPGLTSPGREAPLRASDAPLLAGIAVAGGVLGPILMLFGLGRLPAITSSLLLNLEAPFTMLLAIAVFGEHLDRRALAGATLIVVGGALLGSRTGELGGDWLGVAAVAGACLCWAVDNNLTERLALRDPVAVVRVKALLAGGFSLALALLTRQPWPPPGQLGAALALGSVSYGLSIVLNVRALRALGAARVAAFFATAPFVGAVLAMPLLGERPILTDAAGGLVMIAGVAWLAWARHSHAHEHHPLEHDHLHVHDEHHRHAHHDDAPPESHDVSPPEPHAHPHRHESLSHEHPHVSDAHHRHPHG